MTLSELGKKYGTDKTTYHKFTDFYDSKLIDIKASAENVLEIGMK